MRMRWLCGWCGKCARELLDRNIRESNESRAAGPCRSAVNKALFTACPSTTRSNTTTARRVPEHPQIFERMAARRRGLPRPGQVRGPRRARRPFRRARRANTSICSAPNGGAADAPLALFIHGGYWRSLDPSMFSHLARGMNAHGVTVAVSGYDLVPQVSIADIMAQTQAACLFLWKKFGRRIMVSGHSAGGHLAACMLATDWTKLDAGAPADLVPAAYAISGLYDLAPLLHLAGNAEFKLTEAERARRSRRCSGRRRKARCSTRWWAASNRRNFCGKARSSPMHGRRITRPVTRRCPG